jgi:hypothetical protein
MSNQIKKEISTLVVAMSISLTGFFLLALIRLFDSNTFLFIQISILSVSLLVILYIYTAQRKNRLSVALQGRELVSVVVMFTLLSFSLLNIDRSRSVYLLKWVSISEKSETTFQVFIDSRANSKLDVRDLTQRLNEQKSLKTISIHENQIELTLFGRFIVWTSNFVGSFQNLKGYKSN